MQKSRLLGFYYLSCIAWLLGGCVQDAPHDNPLDPQSPGYTGTGSFGGRVVLVNLTDSGVAGVRIATLPSTLAIMTDSSGRFQFPAIPAGSYDIIASKETYSSDTIHLSIVTGVGQTVTFLFNGSPEVLTTKILTRKIDQWWPNPAYFAELSASVGDPNGVSDIDSVWLSVDSVVFPMAYSVTEKNFQLSLTSYQLPSNNLEWLVGKPLTVVARDLSKSTSTSAPFFVTRMIEQEATPDSPANQDTVTSAPVFQWTPPDVRFVYTYTISVVHVFGGTEATVWSQENVGNHLLTFQYPSTLEKGTYFWTIAVVDEYGNYARSKESPFVVN